MGPKQELRRSSQSPAPPEPPESSVRLRAGLARQPVQGHLSGGPASEPPPCRLLPIGLGIDRLSALCCDHVSGQLEPRPAPPGGAGAVGDGQVRQGSPPACGARGGGWRPATGGRRLSVRSLRPSCRGHTLSARPPAASSVTTGWLLLLLVTLACLRSEAWRPRCVRPGGVTGAACSAQVHCVPR